MDQFEPNKTVVTETPTVTVTRDLPPGQHRFQLIVENDKGLFSDPVVATVTVQRS